MLVSHPGAIAIAYRLSQFPDQQIELVYSPPEEVAVLKPELARTIVL
jgi:hypothetical protein